VFFFEKKNQKTFARLASRKVTSVHGVSDSASAKVFCFFFSKKKTFFLSSRYSASTIVTFASPPPSHIVCSP
jgi:hypothetical protein